MVITKKPKAKAAKKGAVIAPKRSKLLATVRASTTAKNRKLRKKLAGLVVAAKFAHTSVSAYLTATAKKKSFSEAMGEHGAVAYLKHVTGKKLGIKRPKAGQAFDDTFGSTAWAHAVMFNGAGVADVVHWDGSTLHVVEAKGGGSALKTSAVSGRVQRYDPVSGDMRPQAVRQGANPTTVEQGSIDYLTDIAWGMYHSKHADNRTVVGDQILKAIESGKIEYVPVSTKVPPGSTTAVVSVMNF